MTSCFIQSEKTGFGDGTRVRREKRNFKYFNSLHFLAKTLHFFESNLTGRHFTLNVNVSSPRYLIIPTLLIICRVNFNILCKQNYR